MNVGIILSSWGTSADFIAKIGELAIYAKTLPEVVAIDSGYYGPTHEDLEKFKQWVIENHVDRIVLASCRPLIFNETYKHVAVEAGVNKYLIEFIDISELCSFDKKTDLLMEKIKILLRAAVNRVISLEDIKIQKIPVEQSVLIIGGGLIGVEAATRLSDMGYVVHIVEKQPFLGGKTIQLGTCFPSMDCGNCIMPFEDELHRRCMYRSPVSSDININIHTLSELRKLTGVIGNFKATIEKKPRYIDHNRCINCGLCIDRCEGEALNEFDLGISIRKAVYIPSNQSLPRIPYMDLENCRNAEELSKICPVGAINLDMKTTIETINVGVVIVATGFDMFDPTGMYLYGENKDIVSQIELARLLDMSGPTKGILKRISDGEIPSKLVMIQCVGSREPRIHEYCSRICCGIAINMP